MSTVHIYMENYWMVGYACLDPKQEIRNYFPVPVPVYIHANKEFWLLHILFSILLLLDFKIFAHWLCMRWVSHCSIFLLFH